MQHRTLGRTGLEVSVVGFGAWQIGGVGVAAGSLGPADDDESVAAIRRAVELGVTWIDTAPGYGLGHSEEVVRRALRELPEGDRPLVFTKCGFVWDDRDAGELRISLEPASIRAEAEASIGRLGVEALDLYQIHWLEPEDDPYLEGAWETLLQLKAEGLARHVGVSNLTVEQLDRCEAIGPVETLQPPYNLLERSVETELLPWCADHEAGVLVYSPMASGLLSGALPPERARNLPDWDARRLDPAFLPPRLEPNLQAAAALAAWAEEAGRPPGLVAVEWVLGHPTVSAAIVGLRRPEQVDGLLGAGVVPLESAVRDAVTAFAPTWAGLDQSSAGGP